MPSMYEKYPTIYTICHTNGLHTKIKKSAFSVDTTNILDFVMRPDSLHIDDSKIQVIKAGLATATPHKVNEVQSFLGFAYFYY